MPFRAIGSKVQTIEESASTTKVTTITANANGFVCGIAACNGNNDGECFLTVGEAYCGGFIHTPAGLASNIRAGVCFPIKAGQTIKLQITNGTFSGGLFEAV